jgi:hypothetical protein
VNGWLDRLRLFGALIKDPGLPVLVAVYLIGVLTGAFPSFLSSGISRQTEMLEAHRVMSDRLMNDLAEGARRQNRILALLCTAAVDPVLKSECVR